MPSDRPLILCSQVLFYGRVLHPLLWMLVACAGLPAAAEARTFGDSIGVNGKFSQGEPQTDLFRLKELGVRWVRDSVDWKTMEPVAGKYQSFPPAFRDRLAFYRDNHIGVIFGVWYDNTVAYPNTPEQPAHSADAAAYGRYAAEVARQLKHSGVQFVMELYNEPHNTLKWLGGNWNGKPPAPWLDQYVAMVNAAVQQVKAVDPTIRLMDNDDMWILQYWFLEKGLPAKLDALSVHPYVKSWPEFSASEQDTDWARPFVLADADGSFASSVRRLRDQATNKLGRTPAIWVTEWGWPLGAPVNDRPMTEELLAGLVPRALITAADAGVEVCCWFSMQDSVDGPMGLIDNNGTPRLTYTALKTAVAELGPATAWHHLVGDDHRTSGIQVYRFDLPTGTKLVAWDIGGTSDATISDATQLQVHDALGRTVQPNVDAGGRTVLGLSRSPLYIACPVGAVLTPLVPPSVPPVYLFP